jgi:hypothetical protein
MARFNAEFMNTLEPIWQRTPHTNDYVAVDATSLPTHRMITTRSVVNDKSVVVTVAPQVQLTRNHLDVLALVQDSSWPNPRFVNWAIDINDLLRMKESQPLPREHVGAQMSPGETRKEIANHALCMRHLHAEQLLREARAVTGRQYDSPSFPHAPGPIFASDLASVATPANPTVADTSAMLTSDNEEINEILCNMLQGVGPMSGTSYETLLPNCFAMNSRRPYRAENFRAADREEARTPAHQPPLFFHQPESRIANFVITTTLAGLVKLSKNPKFLKFVDACDDLFSPRAVDAQHTLVQIGTALNLVAAQENIAFTCSCDGEELPAQGGGSSFMLVQAPPIRPVQGLVNQLQECSNIPFTLNPLTAFQPGL